MFLNEEFDYTIIDDTITVDFLRRWCKENNIDLHIIDNATTWVAFTQYYGRNHGLDDISATSMSSIVSTLYAGMNVSASTEVYIREEEILFDCIEKLNSLRKQGHSEETVAIMLFNHIFGIYKNQIDKYEYKDENLVFRIGSASLMRFMTVDGDTKSDKFRTLLQHYFSDEWLCPAGHLIFFRCVFMYTILYIIVIRYIYILVLT